MEAFSAALHAGDESVDWTDITMLLRSVESGALSGAARKAAHTKGGDKDG